jgi:catechol 2,3-dioxygenase-like lactoylglutathione lyase family enzyme
MTHAGVHSIDHFALHVPDVAEGRRFFEAFGLSAETEGDDLVVRASESDHRWARLIPGAGRKLAWLALSCYDEHWTVLRDRVCRLATPAKAPAAGPQDGLWFRDPDDNLLRLAIGPKTTPSQPAGGEPGLPAGLGGRRIALRSVHAPVRPTRLSHVLLYTPDIDRSIAFYRDVLGLALSDRSSHHVAFMHGRHGSDHHLVAFGHSSAPGWHHSSWDVPGVDDVGRGAAQMEAAGYPNGWGVGRHVLGSNYFYYAPDPWGSFVEYSAEIDYIPPDTAWEPMDVEAADSLHLWGPPVPADILENTEVEDRGS